MVRRADATLEWLDHPYLYGTERERRGAASLME
jgi:hypothetical protein